MSSEEISFCSCWIFTRVTFTVQDLELHFNWICFKWTKIIEHFTSVLLNKTDPKNISHIFFSYHFNPIIPDSILLLINTLKMTISIKNNSTRSLALRNNFIWQTGQAKPDAFDAFQKVTYSVSHFWRLQAQYNSILYLLHHHILPFFFLLFINSDALSFSSSFSSLLHLNSVVDLVLLPN